MNKNALEALKAFVAWCELQINRSKHSLISTKDEELFAGRFNVSVEQMKDQFEYLGLTEKNVYKQYLLKYNKQYELMELQRQGTPENN